jgi:hypothetical protein
VHPTTVFAYQTKFDGTPFTVPEAVIGVCDVCGAQHFNAKERKRWRQLFEEQREERVTTRITLPKSVHRKLQTLKQVSQRSQSDIVTELIRNA